MAAVDDQGNTIELVDVPYTGAVLMRYSLSNITPEEMEAFISSGAHPASGNLSYLGLLTVDGGPAEESEAGETLEFFQRGYTSGAGEVALSFTVTCAETNAQTHRLVGFTSNSLSPSQTNARRLMNVLNQVVTVVTFVKSRNGRVFAKWGHALPTNGTVGKYERGLAITYEIEFTWNYWDGVETVEGVETPFDRGLYQWLVIEPDGTRDGGTVNGNAVRSHAKTIDIDTPTPDKYTLEKEAEPEPETEAEPEATEPAPEVR